MVRAKFKCQDIKPMTDDGDVTITLQPVTGGSPENESFYKYTPGGQIVLSTVNETAADYFEVGQEYYVDFSAAE